MREEADVSSRAAVLEREALEHPFAAERVGLVRDGELDEPVEAVAGRVVVAEAARRDDDAAGTP